MCRILVAADEEIPLQIVLDPMMGQQTRRNGRCGLRVFARHDGRRIGSERTRGDFEALLEPSENGGVLGCEFLVFIKGK